MVCNLIATSVIVVAAALAFAQVESQQSFRRDYLLPPVLETAGRGQAELDALDDLTLAPAPAAAERAGQHVKELRRFSDLYRRRWQVADKDDAQAARMRAELARIDSLAMLGSERTALSNLDRGLERLERGTEAGNQAPRREDVLAVRRALDALNDTRDEYMRASYLSSLASGRRTLIAVMLVAALAFLAGPIMGMRVWHAIVPRIRRLVHQVRRFRDLGVLDCVIDTGGDEIATLAHALDVSFKALVERDKERAQFLAVAAHEFNTPLMSMKGFADLALKCPEDPAHLKRALSVISRQSTRLARLSQDVLWAARAHHGGLPFKPRPTDLAALTRRVIDEVHAATNAPTSVLHVEGNAHLLADPSLLEHAFWTILHYCVTVSPAEIPVGVSINAEETWVRWLARVNDPISLPQDLDLLLEPFAIVQFEGRATARDTGLGLHLCRMIARLHHAAFHIELEKDHALVFAFELRR